MLGATERLISASNLDSSSRSKNEFESEWSDSEESESEVSSEKESASSATNQASSESSGRRLLGETRDFDVHTETGDRIERREEETQEEERSGDVIKLKKIKIDASELSCSSNFGREISLSPPSYGFLVSCPIKTKPEEKKIILNPQKLMSSVPWMNFPDRVTYFGRDMAYNGQDKHEEKGGQTATTASEEYPIERCALREEQPGEKETNEDIKEEKESGENEIEEVTAEKNADKLSGEASWEERGEIKEEPTTREERGEKKTGERKKEKTNKTGEKYQIYSRLIRVSESTQQTKPSQLTGEKRPEKANEATENEFNLYLINEKKISGENKTEQIGREITTKEMRGENREKELRGENRQEELRGEKREERVTGEEKEEKVSGEIIEEKKEGTFIQNSLKGEKILERLREQFSAKCTIKVEKKEGEIKEDKFVGETEGEKECREIKGEKKKRKEKTERNETKEEREERRRRRKLERSLETLQILPRECSNTLLLPVFSAHGNRRAEKTAGEDRGGEETRRGVWREEERREEEKGEEEGRGEEKRGQRGVIGERLINEMAREGNLSQKVFEALCDDPWKKDEERESGGEEYEGGEGKDDLFVSNVIEPPHQDILRLKHRDMSRSGCEQSHKHTSRSFTSTLSTSKIARANSKRNLARVGSQGTMKLPSIPTNYSYGEKGEGSKRESRRREERRRFDRRGEEERGAQGRGEQGRGEQGRGEQGRGEERRARERSEAKTKLSNGFIDSNKQRVDTRSNKLNLFFAQLLSYNT